MEGCPRMGIIMLARLSCVLSFPFFSLWRISVFWVDPVICSMICLVTENCYSCSIAPLFSSWKRVLVWWKSECCWADIAYWYYTSWTLFSLFSLSWLLVSPVLIFFFGLITENDASEWCCSIDDCSFYGIPGLLSRGVYNELFLSMNIENIFVLW